MANLSPSEIAAINFLEDLVNKYPQLDNVWGLTEFCAGYFYYIGSLEQFQAGSSKGKTLEVIDGMENLQEIKNLQGTSLAIHVEFFRTYSEIFMLLKKAVKESKSLNYTNTTRKNKLTP